MRQTQSFAGFSETAVFSVSDFPLLCCGDWGMFWGTLEVTPGIAATRFIAWSKDACIVIA
jgi:hypothetical protein